MTLVEVLVTLSILISVIIAIGMFQYNVLDYNRSSSTKLINTQEAQVILKVISRELRSMENSSSGTYPISTAGTSTITFYANIDGDVLKEQIRYYLDGTTLHKGVVEPSGSPIGYSGAEKKSTLITGVRNSPTTPVFEYFGSPSGSTSNQLTYPLNLTLIRSVKVNLSVDTDVSKSPLPRTFSTQASLRNLKDNL